MRDQAQVQLTFKEVGLTELTIELESNELLQNTCIPLKIDVTVKGKVPLIICVVASGNIT